MRGAARRPWQDGLRWLWLHEHARGAILQALLLLGLAAGVAVIAVNTHDNLEQAGIALGYRFLADVASFDISQRLIHYDGQSTYARALLVGGLNTVLVAALGIVAATLIGFAAGILRLSNNFLVSRMVGAYVEFTRNVPVLLQIIFWWVVMLNLPLTRESIVFGDLIYLNNRGVRLPGLDFGPGAGWVLLAALAGAAGTWLAARRSRRRRERTGHGLPMLRIGLALLLGLPLAAYFLLGQPFALDAPVAGRFNLQGGINLKPELLALWVALSTYTGAFIAEIVRGGILSVRAGQTEAAAALGLPPKLVVRKIVLPQALRVIVPPLTSQYLNLTKNSSLAVAVGYPDIVSVGDTILNQSGQALEVISIYMLFYLLLSLLTSAFMNWYNARIALERRYR